MDTIAHNAAREHKVLLVDDEIMVLEVGQAILQRLGHHVIVAASGEEAVARFCDNRESICCVVLDLIMPGMDGIATFKQLREMSPEVPVIVSSGLPVDQVLGQFGDTPPASIIQKPYQISELSGKIETLTNRSLS